MHWRFPWRRPHSPAPLPLPNGHAPEDEVERDIAHRAAIRDLEARTERVREWTDAVDLIAGVPATEEPQR